MKNTALFLCLSGALGLAGVARAVGTSYWKQTSEADFKSGTVENVVATNLGDLKLSRAVKTLLEQDPKISSVNILAEAPDGGIYAGTGPHGVLLKIKDEKISTVATIPDGSAILSLVVDKAGGLIVGTGGEAGRVLYYPKVTDAPRTLFESEGVQYVWALAQTPDGNIYAATGPKGALYEIKPDGSKRALMETAENNLLSLVSDGKDLLYVGTDPHGLVYRVNRRTGESFVLYNAAESEVSALALDKNGNLYAGTSEAKQEPTIAEEPIAPEKSGRPEGGAVGVPIPADRPKEPTPPAPPNPNPGQPDPIPKNPQTRAYGGWVTFALETSGVGEVSPDDSPKAKKRPRPGEPTPGPTPNPTPRPGKPEVGAPSASGLPPVHQPTVDTTAGAEAPTEGNAIYRIDPDGFVTEVFRQPVLILSMVESNGTLLVATGGKEGQVYQVRPSADETLVLAKVDAKEIMCLLAAHDGKTYLGTANVGSVASMTQGYASRGTYTSPVLDATQISRFGKIRLHGTLPPGATLTIATRSGNVKEADEKSWSKWSDEAPAAEFLQVMSPSARFLQFRLTFTSAEGKASPVVRDVGIAYQVPNLPPQIKAVKIVSSSALNAEAQAGLATDPETAPPHHVESARKQTIAWEASDANNDTLAYSLAIRPVGESEWIQLKEKLSETSYEWDTRTVADGRYEVKVTASDAASNPPGMGKTASRVSDPITVDNTPPVIGDVKTQQRGGEIHVDLKAVDRTSTVAAVEYSVDSNKEWQFVLPTDQIYDSPEETVSFSIPGLKAGQHQITLRATDSKGNQAFENVFVSVQSGAAAR